MPGNAHNLLTESWISTIDANGHAACHTLPGVLHALGNGRELEFSALQGHQRQAWYAFLVQLGAMSITCSGGAIDQDTNTWHNALLKLAGGNRNAWFLVVDDLSQPAFFQPPVPEKNLKNFKQCSNRKKHTQSCGFSPDCIDLLIAAKNFDLKIERFNIHPSVEDWAFALTNAQTMHGYLGSGHYGVSRMNGGSGNRPQVGISPDLSWSARFCRDVAILLSSQDRLIRDYNFKSDGLSLLWLHAWSGDPQEALDLEALNPFYLEVCRRIRLSSTGSGIQAFKKTTKGMRIAAKELKGVVGDPWTPIFKEGKALTVSSKGFSYQTVHKILLSKDLALPIALRAQPQDGSSYWVCLTALVRGEGVTEGFHHRWVLVPGNFVLSLDSGDQREALAQISEERIGQVRRCSREVLRPALLKLLQERIGQPLTGNQDLQDSRPQRWLDAFDLAVDDSFFEHLFADFAAIQRGSEAQTKAHRAWNQHLYKLMREQLEAAKETLTPSGIHRYRAIAQATSFFEGRVQQLLALEPPGDASDTTDSSQNLESEVSSA